MGMCEEPRRFISERFACALTTKTVTSAPVAKRAAGCHGLSSPLRVAS